MPVGIETYGVYVKLYGPQAIKLIKQIGKKNTGSYQWKTAYFLSYADYLNGNTTRQRFLHICPKKTSTTGLDGLFNFHVQEAEMLW